MPKETFDQVSAVMWGQAALDYHKNYIVPRTYWDDSDIRDEALYFAGLGQGLRVGATQKPRQPVMHQASCKDQTSTPVVVNSDQTGSSNSAHLVAAKHGGFVAEFQPQVAPNAGPSRRPGVAPPLQNAPNNGQSHPFESGKAYQRTSTTTVKGAGHEIETPFGVLSAPDGTTLSIPITDSQASKELQHNPGSQPSVAAGRRKNIVNPLFETIPESTFGEDYPVVYTSPTLEGDSDQEACYEEMERFFGGQGAESGDADSDIGNGTYWE